MQLRNISNYQKPHTNQLKLKQLLKNYNFIGNFKALLMIQASNYITYKYWVKPISNITFSASKQKTLSWSIQLLKEDFNFG